MRLIDIDRRMVSTNIKDIDFLLTTTVMLYSSFKQKKIAKTVIFVILLTCWAYTAGTVNATITADWGDVVDVHYFRYTNPDYTGIEEDNEITHIYLSQGSTVPADVAALFPDTGISAGYFSDFKAGIIGLSLNGQNQFTALQEGQYYYFLVTLLSIRYDAVIDGSTTTTTTPSGPVQTIDTLFLIGGGLIIVIGIIFFTFVSGNQQRKRALSEESSSIFRQKKSLSSKKIKLKELRKLAESHNPGLDVEEPTKSDVKFRRRK